MSTHFNAITVLLEEDMREPDVTRLCDAIKLMRGVLKTKLHIADLRDELAYERARKELTDKLFAQLKETRP